MDLSFLSAKCLAALVRRGEIGCLELLDQFIARTERLDGRTNTVVVRDFDRARKRARTLDRRRKQGTGKKLFGVPMTVKESFDVAGLPTTWGVLEFKDTRAETNALAVDRLPAAVAVVFGKSNVPLRLITRRSLTEIADGSLRPRIFCGRRGAGLAPKTSSFSAKAVHTQSGVQLSR
jgi:amidase